MGCTVKLQRGVNHAVVSLMEKGGHGGMTIDKAQVGWGFAPGTFGELVHGEIDDVPFLITLSIPWGTRATFAPTPGQPLNVWPAYRKKAKRAAELLLTSWGIDPEGTVVLQSTLPVGKGMASSSADVVATLRAVAASFGRQLSPRELASLAAEVEPTDGIMFPGVVAFDPLRGRLLERLGQPPPMLIAGVLGRGRINTEDHHRRWRSYTPEQQHRIQEALAYARDGVRARDVDLIGRAGRISAEVEAERDPDPALDEFLSIAKEEDVGVIIAHSGTVRGVVLPASVPRAKLRHLEQRLWSLNAGAVHRLPVAAPPLKSLAGNGVCNVGPVGLLAD